MAKLLLAVCKALWRVPLCRSCALAVTMVGVSFLVLSAAGYAQSASSVGVPGTSAHRPGFEWTTIQDLKPDARAINRPIKDKWAVVVGIGNFAEKPLNNELKMDLAAKEFYNYLTDPGAGRFDKNHVRLLVDADATRQNILASVGPQWLGQVAGPDDLVVVFIATHGFPAGDGNTYICTYNSMLDNLYATGISMGSFMQSLRRNVCSDRIVLVLQACYSGAAELTSGAKALFKTFNVDLEKVVLGKGYVILSSSRPDQITWGDIFSSNLVKALRQDDGFVPLRKAFDVARERTEYDTTHDCIGCKPQTPVIKTDWTGNELTLGTPPIERVRAVPSGVVNYLAAESHYMLASKQAAVGDLDGALKEYKAALETDSKYADAYCDYGSVLAMLGDWGGAARQFEQAIQLQPDDSLFRSNYARVLAKLGRDEESGSELETAYRLNPKDRVVLTALADRASKAGNYNGAADYLREALELYPRSAALHDRLSYIQARSGQLAEALEHAHEAVKLDPKSASARLNQGAILLLRGDETGSVAAYREAVRLAPDSADAHYLLSSALEAVHAGSEARNELTKFLELCSAEDPRAAIARKHLTELTAR